ncbi:hypothetical protein BN14_08414 [Rhizoctonia solani AG-1 IB]|uniref:Uncharacterized protein n=1 Tax=Thanatephorus cucumeris (strain AG1-IB / isolate 7/3/14) TaxID=1108050 RepID=M5CEG2_THACB|nr:hypothetical protein BN14_08414 [Rhizoctonia solani AG-1 IB]
MAGTFKAGEGASGIEIATVRRALPRAVPGLHSRSSSRLVSASAQLRAFALTPVLALAYSVKAAKEASDTKVATIGQALSPATCLGYNPEPSPQGSFDHTHAPTPLHSPSPSPEPLLSLSPSPSPSPSPEPLLSLSPSPSSSTCPSLSLSPSPEPSPPLPEPARSPAASKSPPPAEPSRAPSLEFIPETPPDSFEHTDAPAPEPEPSHPPESKLESETESEPEPEPMPDLLNKAHDEVAVLADYTKRWEKIERMVRPGHHEVEAFLSFAAIPWPMLHTPSGPSDITRQSVREFVILSRTRDQTARAWRRAFLLRWHPDKFKRWMSFVVPVDRASVIAAVTAIATIANELMSDESI